MPNLSAGRPVRALDFTQSKDTFAQVTISDITSTSYEAGTPAISALFVAPTSGRVAVNLSANVRNNAANADRVFVSYRVTEAEDVNDVFQAPDVRLGISNWATGTEEGHVGGHMTMVDGLTPGRSYYVQVLHRATIGAGADVDIISRAISVIPLP